MDADGVIFFIAIAVTAAIYFAIKGAERRKLDAMSPEERAAYLIRQQNARDNEVFGPVNAAMVCPHCGTRGNVRTKLVSRKKGISGGKATAAIMTGGVSMLATGLSRKEQFTSAFCGYCRNRWDF
jgi:hypothetical protein